MAMLLEVFHRHTAIALSHGLERAFTFSSKLTRGKVETLLFK